MRILLIVQILFQLVRAQSQGQQLPIDKNYYYEKGVKQQITGWVFLGAGTVMIVGGIIGAKNADFFDDDWGASTRVMLLGIPVSAISIPFFISGAKNKGIAKGMAGVKLLPTYLYDIHKPVLQSGVFLNIPVFGK